MEVSFPIPYGTTFWNNFLEIKSDCYLSKISFVFFITRSHRVLEALILTMFYLKHWIDPVYFVDAFFFVQRINSFLFATYTSFATYFLFTALGDHLHILGYLNFLMIDKFSSLIVCLYCKQNWEDQKRRWKQDWKQDNKRSTIL